MTKFFGCLAILAMIGMLLAGCEWDNTTNSASWDDSYSWVNFSGTYRAQDGGEMVVNHGVLVINPDTTVTGSVTKVEYQKVGEGLGTDVGDPNVYSGTLHIDLVAGTVTIVAGGFIFTDDGTGNLTTSGGLNGTIEYATGAWSIDFGTGGIANGEDILATYSYDSRKTPGSTTTALDYPWSGIYSMRVEQLGNHVRIVDGKFGTYEGVVTTVSNGGGDMSGTTSGNVEAQFEVTGVTLDGRKIRIVGSFLGGYIAPSQGTSTTGSTGGGTPVGTGSQFGALQGRILQAIWVEPDGTTADVVGQAGSVTVDLTPYIPITSTTTTR